MKRVMILLGFLSVLGRVGAVEIGDSFIFDKSKLDIGGLYIYESSDYDGNEKVTEYVYVKDENSIEYLRDRFSVGDGLWLHKEKINKEFFMFEENRFETILTNSDEYTVKSSYNPDYKKREVTGEVTRSVKGKIEKREKFWEIGKDDQYPYFEAGNSLAQFNTFVRFLNLKKKNTEIGISNIWGDISSYTIVFEKEESIEGINCLRYKLKPKGFFAGILDKTGNIWIKKDDPKQTLVKYRLNQRISPTLKNEMSLLKEVKKLDYDEWKKFIEEKKRELEEGLGF